MALIILSYTSCYSIFYTLINFNVYAFIHIMFLTDSYTIRSCYTYLHHKLGDVSSFLQFLANINVYEFRKVINRGLTKTIFNIYWSQSHLALC